MTIEEAKEFLKQAFIAFPGLMNWVKDNSPDPQATIQVWSLALESIKQQEAISVLNRWVKNELVPPTGWHRESFVQRVIEVVKNDRNKSYPERHREEVFEQLNLKQPKWDYKPQASHISDVLGLKASYELGQISFEELTKQVEERKQQAMDSVK